MLHVWAQVGDCSFIHRMGYGNDFTDARGNVDRDSDEEEGQPEAFNPQYESLPALRPAQPPQYKPTPNYPHGGTVHVIAEVGFCAVP